MTDAYLIKFVGFEDSNFLLVDKPTWEYIEACGNWDKFTKAPIPQPPDWLIDRTHAYHAKDNPKLRRAEAASYITMTGGPHDWDECMCQLPPTEFNGEAYDPWDDSVTELMAFCKKHNLTIVEESEGTLF